MPLHPGPNQIPWMRSPGRCTSPRWRCWTAVPAAWPRTPAVVAGNSPVYGPGWKPPPNERAPDVTRAGWPFNFPGPFGPVLPAAPVPGPLPSGPLRLKVAQVVTTLGIVEPEHLVVPAQAEPQRRAVSVEDAVRLAAHLRPSHCQSRRKRDWVNVTNVTRTKPWETETGGNMTNRNLLLGRSKPSEKLTREEIAARAHAAAGEAVWEEGRQPAADGQQGSPQVPLELRVPWMRLQGHRRWPSPARATPGEVRPLQSGPRPRRRVMVGTTPSTSTRRH